MNEYDILKEALIRGSRSCKITYKNGNIEFVPVEIFRVTRWEYIIYRIKAAWKTMRLWIKDQKEKVAT